MRIAVIGIRGIPVVYSGYETFAENLATKLAKKGYEFTVYGRDKYVDKRKKKYKGVNLVSLPALEGKGIETFSHSFISTLHASIFGNYDIIYYLGVGSSLFSFIPRIFGIKTVVNVDGLDWKREKWGFFGKFYLSLSEYFATVFPNRPLTDSSFIKKYYKDKYKKDTVCIPYGYYEKELSKEHAFRDFGLKKEKYIIWSGRLVPDNHLDELIKAFKDIKNKKGVVMVVAGDDTSKTDHTKQLKEMTKGQKDIKFVGFLEREIYANLLDNALLYVETKRSGGTHPSLVEAMGYGNVIISNDHPANKEVLGQGAIFYKLGSVKDLKEKLEYVLSEGKKTIKKIGKKAEKRANSEYNWKKVISKYDEFFENLKEV